MSPLPPLNQPAAPAPAAPAKKDVAPLMPPMAIPQGFRGVTPQPLRAWDTPGQKVYAYFLQVRDSTKYPGRKLVDFVDDDGVVLSYACPIILEQLLLGLPTRTVVLVHYRGEEKTAKGETKHFELFLPEGTK